MNTFDMVKIVKKIIFLINRHLYHYRPHPRLPHHLRPCLLPHHHHRNVTDEDEADALDTSYTDEEDPSDFYTQAPRPEYNGESPSFYTSVGSRNKASESQQHYSTESMDNSLEKKKAFKNFFYKFYETLRRRAAQEKQRIRNREKAKTTAFYDEVETKEDFGDGFKAIKVHAVEIDPFIEEGFEPILEYELD